MKRSDWLKKEYAKLAVVVNAYQSEKVQLVIVERLLPLLEKDCKFDDDEVLPDNAMDVNPIKAKTIVAKPKSISATWARTGDEDSDRYIFMKS